jgi:hypothetical protein
MSTTSMPSPNVLVCCSRSGKKPEPAHWRLSAAEDADIHRLVAEFPDSWVEIAKRMPGRNARQVRERYFHYLSPTLNLS